MRGERKGCCCWSWLPVPFEAWKFLGFLQDKSINYHIFKISKFISSRTSLKTFVKVNGGSRGLEHMNYTDTADGLVVVFLLHTIRAEWKIAMIILFKFEAVWRVKSTGVWLVKKLPSFTLKMKPQSFDFSNGVFSVFFRMWYYCINESALEKKKVEWVNGFPLCSEATQLLIHNWLL